MGLAQGADDGETVGAREHAVENDGSNVFARREEIGESSVAVGFVVSAIALGLEVEEKTLGEVLFIFDENDQGGSRLCHRAFRVCCKNICDFDSY